MRTSSLAARNVVLAACLATLASALHTAFTHMTLAIFLSNAKLRSFILLYLRTLSLVYY